MSLHLSKSLLRFHIDKWNYPWAAAAAAAADEAAVQKGKVQLSPRGWRTYHIAYTQYLEASMPNPTPCALLTCLLVRPALDIPFDLIPNNRAVIKKIWFRIGSTNLRIQEGGRRKGQGLHGILNLLANLICRLQEKPTEKSKIRAYRTHSALVIGFCKVIVYSPPLFFSAFFFWYSLHLKYRKSFLYRKRVWSPKSGVRSPESTVLSPDSWVWDMHAKSWLTKHTKVLNDFCLLFAPHTSLYI